MRRHWLLLFALVCLASRAALGADGVVDVVEKPAPLVEAVRAKDSARVAELLGTHLDVNQRTSDGTSALHWAVYNNDAALVDRLLAAGADVNAKNDYGSTPLSE